MMEHNTIQISVEMSHERQRMVKKFGHKKYILLRIPLFLISLIFASSCESTPPQLQSAIAMSWGETNQLQIAPKAELEVIPWRKVVVLTPGVLAIGLQSNADKGKVKLNVFDESGRRSLFLKEVELAPRSPLKVSINVAAGTYYVVLEPLGLQSSLNASIEARFMPEDPDALSGSDKNRQGAQLLINAQPKEGAVSYKDSNRTDWFKYEITNSETIHIHFKPSEEARGVKAECISPTGLSFELSGQDKIVVREPGTLWIRVSADNAESGGSYKLTALSSPLLGAERKGLILKLNRNNATVNLGIDDGIREGIEGYIQRPDGAKLDFVIEKALRRSSTAKADSAFRDEDLNLPVHFDKKSNEQTR